MATRRIVYGYNDIAGAILGHGATIIDDDIQFVVIPEGIELQPFSRLGCDLELGADAPTFGKDEMDIYSTKDMRSGTWAHGDPDEMMAHIYKPGDIIYNMQISFRFTWDENTEGAKPRYYTTGIVTGGKLMEDIEEAEGEGTNRELTRSEIDDSLRGHDASVFPDFANKRDIWDRTMTLGEILKYLAEHRQRRIDERVATRVASEGAEAEERIREEESREIDRYYVVSCRGLGGRAGRIPEIECFPDDEGDSADAARPSGRARLRLSEAEILTAFLDNMDFIRHSLVRRSRALDTLYQRVVARLAENNTISKDDFCEIKRYVEFLKRDHDLGLDDEGMKKKVMYAANRTRLCNMFEVMRALRAQRYNVTPDLNEVIVANIPKNANGTRNRQWIERVEAVIDNASHRHFIGILRRGIAQYTGAIGDNYTCTDPHAEGDIMLGGANYYKIYMENRANYMRLR
jgi:hypothetical protein